MDKAQSPVAGMEPVTVMKATLKEVNLLLRRRTAELAAAHRLSRRETTRREAMEKKLETSEQHYGDLLQESRLMQEKMRNLARRALLAQEEERKEISRELHDDIAQTLTAINVHLATLNKEVEVSGHGISKKIAATQRLAGKTVNIVHRFARDLRPTLLDDLGLIPALHSYMKEFTKRTRVLINFTAFAGVEQLSNDRRTVLYRVAQSALTNISQHAKASKVKVSIQKFQNTIRMEIHDNGKSFEVERVVFARHRKRLGLLGMRERLEMVGGNFNVESSPGKGTTIIARVPFANGKFTRGKDGQPRNSEKE